MSLAVLAVAYMLVGPACVWLPWSPGAPPVERRIVGADGSGRWYVLEARRRLGFAWGLRWWFEFNPHALAGVGGIEYVPPLRFATASRYDWRIVTSGGGTQMFAPPVEPLPDVSPERLRFLAPAVLDDGTWVVFSSDSIFRLEPHGDNWSHCPQKRPATQPRGRLVASTIAPSGIALDVYSAGPAQGRLSSDHTTDQLTVMTIDVRTGITSEPGTIRLPGQRPESASRYDLSVRGIDDGWLLFETFSERGPGPGSGRAFKLARDLSRIELMTEFTSERGERLSFSASCDGALFTSGEYVYRTTSGQVRRVGPFSSSVWIGHELIGVRRYPFFAERVRDRSQPLRSFLNALRNPLLVPWPGSWGGDRDMRLYVEALDATGALDASRSFLGGVDESGRSDEIQRIAVE